MAGGYGPYNPISTPVSLRGIFTDNPTCTTVSTTTPLLTGPITANAHSPPPRRSGLLRRPADTPVNFAFGRLLSERGSSKIAHTHSRGLNGRARSSRHRTSARTYPQAKPHGCGRAGCCHPRGSLPHGLPHGLQTDSDRFGRSGERRSGQRKAPHITGLSGTGATGLEPATSGLTVRCSNQAELHPPGPDSPGQSVGGDRVELPAPCL
jgi:hypothetical protein